MRMYKYGTDEYWNGQEWVNEVSRLENVIEPINRMKRRKIEAIRNERDARKHVEDSERPD